MRLDPDEHPHRRYNPLTGDWVLVSPHRTKRPWQGQDLGPAEPPGGVFEPACVLCPRNTRAGGQVNPDYTGTFVFDNDFAALLPATTEAVDTGPPHPLFRRQAAGGVSRVICFSPDHSRSLPELSDSQVDELLQTQARIIDDLGARYPWVQLFENRGEQMGCSQPHPHAQVWATSYLPSALARKDQLLREYHAREGTNLLLDYSRAERKDGARTVTETRDWLAVVPYWAAWPFETLLLPKTWIPAMGALSDDQRKDLATILKQLTTRYDNLFECAFPYSMGWHFAPLNLLPGDLDHWQLHAMFYPPLLRSATVRKYMVGFEMLAEAQRDITPEQAAARLREVSDQHYRSR